MPGDVGKCKALAIAIQHIFELFCQLGSNSDSCWPFFHRRSFLVCVRTQSRWETINKKWVGIPLSLFSNKTTKNRRKSTESFRKTFSQKFITRTHRRVRSLCHSVSFRPVFFFTTIIAVQYLRFRLERIPFFSHSLQIMFYRETRLLGTWLQILERAIERNSSSQQMIIRMNNYFQLFDWITITLVKKKENTVSKPVT